jgi:CheY-like chemotaxis protein
MNTTSFGKIDRKEFDQLVREALKHLFDYVFLDNHPLVKLLVLPGNRTAQPAQDLRHALFSAIRSLSPAKNIPQQSHDWRGYQILEMRFIGGMESAEVMRRLGLGHTLYFTEQNRILQLLTDVLWNQYVSQLPIPTSYPGQTSSQAKSDESDHGVHSEISRLLSEANWGEVNVNDVISNLRPIIQSQTQIRKVSFSYNLDQLVLVNKADRVILRQVFLNLISEMLEKVNGGMLYIMSFEQQGVIGISLRGTVMDRSPDHTPIESSERISQDMYRDLLHAMQGEIQFLVSNDRNYEVELSWKPSNREPHILLAIDDNSDMLSLFQRYLASQGWKVIGARNMDEARHVIHEIKPEVIILDVLLPIVDGWELLMTLKSDPATREIPVIVCSALNEPELSKSLGAADFLPKPVSQQKLISTLNLVKIR